MLRNARRSSPRSHLALLRNRSHPYRTVGKAVRSSAPRDTIPARASVERKAEVAHAHDQYHRRYGDLLQGLGFGPADRLQPWVAAVGRRLGHPDAVLFAAGLSGHRA